MTNTYKWSWPCHKETVLEPQMARVHESDSRDSNGITNRGTADQKPIVWDTCMYEVEFADGEKVSPDG